MSHDSLGPPEPLSNDVAVSPSTGLDSELRQFLSRLMAGYEAAHRTLVAHSDMLAARLEQAEGVTARALELQVRLAEEREELLSKKHKRELEADAARAKQAALIEVSRDIRALLAVGGKKLLGVPLTGNDSHGLQDLLATFDGPQIEAAMSGEPIVLSPAQRQLLISVLGSLAEGEQKANALTEGERKATAE